MSYVLNFIRDNNCVQVLSSADFTLINFLLDHVPKKTVFLSSGPLLSQTVLLSLIQQLSLDLMNNTESKLSWMQMALMSIDRHHPLISAHVSPIMQGVQKNLDNLISHLEESDPENPSLKTAPLLLFVVRSLNS